MENIHLLDLVEHSILQELQDHLSAGSEIAIGIAGVNGESLTEARNLSDFCEKFTKSSPTGKERCHQCDIHNAREALHQGKACYYCCHAGLVDFTAPITVGGELYGYVVGGQVVLEPLKEKEVYALAEELGLNPEDYWEAAKKIRIINNKELEKTISFINSIAHIISDLATNKLQVMCANLEIEAASKMKSDFLANMSHEIRTPMNAVIGMADMALREELSPSAREYILQIKQSGRTLLAIINDILDFSKIESGKMDITMAEYSPMKLIDGVSNIIATRLQDKDVELIVDVDPNIPGELMGDDVRIRQIITNLAGNAAKFTRQGKIVISVTCQQLGERMFQLSVSVEDTGIGIKKEDLVKLFSSFQQVDSKRNRNIEGTGLGLAISKQLVELMGGKIGVESEYEKGSRFYFTVPQLQMQQVDSIRLDHPDQVHVGAILANKYVREQLKKDINALGAQFHEVDIEERIGSAVSEGMNFLFLGDEIDMEQAHSIAKEYSDITVVRLARLRENCQSDCENLIIMRKPISIYPLILLLNYQDIHRVTENEEDVYEIAFVAPKAKVLIVDDNEVNLTVAKGLLDPLRMKVDISLSGKDAIEKITTEHYDLIFMDHMMPEMDGIETTHIIRRMYPDYDTVPIIALTANAMEESKAMFLCEGMNDFVAKPIEVKALVEMVHTWLPKELIEKKNSDDNKVDLDKQTEKERRHLIEGLGLDVHQAIGLLGSFKLYWQVLLDYVRVIPKKSALIDNGRKQENLQEYTVQVHALKSSSRQIGAGELGDLAAMLEKAGNDKDVTLIEKNTDLLLQKYRSLGEQLSKIIEQFEVAQSGNGSVQQMQDKEQIHQLISESVASLWKDIDDLDTMHMEETVNKLKACGLPEQYREICDQLSDAVMDMDIDRCEELLKMWDEAINLS